MSIEQLLFFALLIGIPLLDRLIRAMRARTNGTPARPAPAGAPPAHPPARVSVPAAGNTGSKKPARELPQAGRPVARDPLPAIEREPRIRRERKHGLGTGVRARRWDRPASARRVVARRDLRRAIVLMTIIGPCRALQPMDAG
jgi:hypothetical protein